MRFTLPPVEDDAFFETAPFRLGDTIPVARPAAGVWADLTADGTLSWCRLISRVEWTSPRPFGVGTTRTVRAMGGVIVLDERYFRWEEGRRKSFYLAQANAPLFKRFAEDYLVEPDGEGACRLTWRFAAVPRLPGPNKQLLGSLLRDTRRHYGA